MIKKKHPNEITLEVPKQTLGLFPEVLNALSVMSCFILAVIFYRGVQNFNENRVIPETPVIAQEKVIKPTTVAPVAPKVVAEVPTVIEAPKGIVEPVPAIVAEPIVKKVVTTKRKKKDITSVKSVFRFKYKKQEAYSINNFNFFRPSSFKVSKGGKKRLNKLIPFLKGQKIMILGHTDPIPAKFVPAREWNTNAALSEFRAKAIKKYLVSKGLKGKLIKIGKGRKIRKKDREGTRGATFVFN